jgi:hypothetical protein
VSTGSRNEVVRFQGSNRWYDTTISFGLCTLPPTVTPTNGTDSTSANRSIGESWNGADTPDYQARIKAGIACTNPYSKSWTRYVVTPCSGGHIRQDMASICGGTRVTRYRTEAWRYEVAPLMPTGVPVHVQLAQTMAAQQFTRRSRERLSEAQALVTGGETREAVRMVLGARRAVFDKLRSFQKSAVKNTKGIKNVKGRKKAVANAWLEYSFGWSPLVADSVNLANAAAAVIAGSCHARRVSGSGEVISVIEEGNGHNWHLGTGGTDARSRLIAHSKCRFFGMLRFETGQAGRFKSQFGLTMDNWVPSIWELIPWSFAIDYFTGFGDFLSSITLPLSEFLYYGRSRKATLTREYYDMKKTIADVTTSTAVRRYWATPGTSRAEKGIFERDIPAYIVRPPSLRVPGYKQAYFNLGALAVLRNNNRI